MVKTAESFFGPIDILVNAAGVNLRENWEDITIESWEKTGTGYEFARSQTHHSMEGRHIVRESTLDKYQEKPNAGNEIRDYHLKHMVTLYPEKEYPGHHWVLMVDLNACNGCSTCVIACQAENNTERRGRTRARVVASNQVNLFR